jgi:hypothetical protein
MMVHMNGQNAAPGRIARACLPAVVEWTSRGRALLNLLLFDLAVLAGAWVVHSAEYTIEYGTRVGAVIASSDHRYYMTAAGWILAFALLCTVAFCSLAALRQTHRARILAARLPLRLRARVDGLAAPVSVARAGSLVAALFVCQVAFYLIQENLEVWNVGAALPGFQVLVAPQHVTVLPLHLLVAWISALLLTGAGVRLRRRDRLASLVGRLVHLLSHSGPRHVSPPAFPPRCTPRPLIEGAPGQRGPPFSA